MTNIETEHVSIKSSQEEVYNFLTDFNNFEKLLPKDKVENWNSTSNNCTFRIKGMTDIGMEIANKTPFKEINISSYGKVPFNFKLNIFLENTTENTSEAYMIFSGDINPFMKMMVEKPLTNFFNMLANNLAKVFE